jgi:hypothetical protein
MGRGRAKRKPARSPPTEVATGEQPVHGVGPQPASCPVPRRLDSTGGGSPPATGQAGVGGHRLVWRRSSARANASYDALFPRGATG